MNFSAPLKEASLIRRYKRFLADVRLPDGQETTLHCPNTGAMLGCAQPGSRVWYSLSDNPARKYPGTWELVETPGGHLACINTLRANALVAEALGSERIATLAGYAVLRREVLIGCEGSRIDFVLSGHARRPDELCHVEVKSVTMALPDGSGAFPDAVTTRGTRHLRELLALRQAGHRAVLLFCVQHTGIACVRPAVQIDPAYADMLQQAVEGGVEVLAWRSAINVQRMHLQDSIPFELVGA
jgi:sugar fermentation stimulation protein A